MKKSLVTAVALAGLWAGAAAAADMGVPPSYAPPPPTPWSGFYVGAVGGWGQATANLPDFGVSTRETGWTLGATVGYNWHINSAVFGVEGDISTADLQGGCATVAIPNCVVRMTFDSTIRARLGLPYGAVMPYVTGGAMVTGHHFTGFENDNGFMGWAAVVGGGVEWWVAPHWSVKVEDLVSVTTANIQATSAGGIISSRIDEKNVNLVRFGINYQFGAEEAPAPLIHK
jgi:outer membrane immunogenic protein